MPLKGDLQALRGFEKKLSKLKGASQEIARRVSPKIEPLVNESIGASATPYGDPWKPTKSGQPALSGAVSSGRVLVRLVGKSTIRTALLYPLHFHHGGTRTHGRRAQRKMRRDLEAEMKVKTLGAAGRVAARLAIKRKLGWFEAMRRAGMAGNVWDPERPIIPSDAQGVPAPWGVVITGEAREVMREAGAVEKK